jgi:aconitate hydratase
MRLPDIIGVELSGKPQPGITATDIVLALTEFLRKEKVVSAYLEFYGEGAAALTWATAPPSPTWRRNSAPPPRCSPSTSRPSSTSS